MIKNYLLLISVLLITFSGLSQDYSQKTIYSWYDKQSGIENSILFRGIEYVEKDRMINEKHKFFKTQLFQNGSLTYDGQTFYGVPLKYNIFNDLLLVNLQQGSKNLIFQLIRNKVDSFTIDSHKFKYLNDSNLSEIEGFYEVINDEEEFKIYKKYLQNSRELRDENVAYIEFSMEDSIYIYQLGTDFYKLGNRNDLISKFPQLKKEIRNFYKQNKLILKDSPEVFMSNLAREMNILISSLSNKV